MSSEEHFEKQLIISESDDLDSTNEFHQSENSY